MKLDLTELARTVGMHAEEKINEPCPPDLGLECSSNVVGDLKLDNTGSLLIVRGKIEAGVKLECSRCLIDFVMPVQAEIEEQFRIEKVGDAFTILPLEEEESAELVKNNVLDVDELVRQNLLLGVPFQPLCKPECAGLCPTCGENLNVRQCGCPPAEIDSPFKALADLLEEEEK